MAQVIRAGVHALRQTRENIFDGLREGKRTEWVYILRRPNAKKQIPISWGVSKFSPASDEILHNEPMRSGRRLRVALLISVAWTLGGRSSRRPGGIARRRERPTNRGRPAHRAIGTGLAPQHPSRSEAHLALSGERSTRTPLAARAGGHAGRDGADIPRLARRTLISPHLELWGLQSGDQRAERGARHGRHAFGLLRGGARAA